MSAAPVTEAHRQAAVSIFELAMKSAHHGAPFREPCAQLIADSEARATAELLQQVANLKYANHYHRKTAETSRATETDRNNLRADLDAIKAILTEEKDRAERAEVGEAEQKWLKESAVKRAKELTAELDGIRALADRRNKRYHVEDTTHQLVAALDQALDIAQAELAAERARLDSGQILLTVAGERVWHSGVDLRAAIDAAMKEGA